MTRNIHDVARELAEASAGSWSEQVCVWQEGDGYDWAYTRALSSDHQHFTCASFPLEMDPDPTRPDDPYNVEYLAAWYESAIDFEVGQ
jgi:hypothetical protein